MRPSISKYVAVLTLILGLCCASSAFADTLSWSISGSGVSGSGTFTATNEGNGEYFVTGMTGDLTITYDGVTTGGAITSFTAYTGAVGTSGIDPTGLYDYDDLVYPNANPELDLWGVVFNVAGFTDPLNLCGGPGCDNGNPPYILWDVNTAGPSNTLGYGSNYNAYVVNFSDSVPEPSALALLSLGLLAIVFLRVRQPRCTS